MKLLRIKSDHRALTPKHGAFPWQGSMWLHWSCAHQEGPESSLIVGVVVVVVI